jgi:hypothetical protein
MNDQDQATVAPSDASLVPQIAEKPVEPPHKMPPIALRLQKYLLAIHGIGQTAQIALPHIAKWAREETQATEMKIEKYLPSLPKEGEEAVTFTLDSARDFAEFTHTVRRLQELAGHDAPAVLAKSLFTQLFAEFDAYIGELLTVVYLKNDKLLKGISREISLSDLMNFDDLNAVKRSILDKEIETFRRDSYIDQFTTLEKKFGLTLRKFKEWSDFVELSQRRNILTHNGGMVSDQYLDVCDREGHSFKNRPQTGNTLGVSYEYFTTASRLLSKVGLMLAYTLWTKVFPKEVAEIHKSLNDTIYHCLQQNRWRFVAELNDFVLSDAICKDITEIQYKIRIVNTSIGLKFSGKDIEAAKLLDAVDWSASYRDFKLATAVLRAQYDDAISIMKSIGKSGEIIEQTSYHTWPLFTRFRERPEFYDAYSQIYGEPFAERVETPKGSVEAHAKASDSLKANLGGLKVIDADASEIDSPSGASKRIARKSPRRPKVVS